MNQYMIGVDIGTTSTKAVLFTTKGEVLNVHHVEYPMHTPTPHVAEQNPDEIYEAVITSINKVIDQSQVNRSQVELVSFSSAMHSLIAVDSHGKPLTNCITWADNRAANYAEQLKSTEQGHGIYMRTGTPIHPMSPLCKLMWLKEERPELLQGGNKFISIKEYVFYQLFGEYVIDYSIASATGMFNLEQLDWDEEALAVAGVSREQLSKIVPTTHYLKLPNDPHESPLNLLSGTPFVVGASDGVLSNLGLAASEPGVVVATIGTSGAIRTVVDKPVVDPKGRMFCYALTDKKWVIGGPVNNGGMILRWVMEEFAAAEVEAANRLGVSPYELLMDIAEKVPAGSDGLIFHPYLSGERAPLWNANARGSFFGLSLHHKKEHFIRAALEGVMYNLYSVLLALKELIGTPGEIKATGGFARSKLWRQIMADVFNTKVVIPESFESSCLGATILGLYALGKVDSLDVVKEMVGHTNEHVPNEDNVDLYQELMTIYIRVARALEDEYANITAFQKQHSKEKEY
ncbi:gluconokinase [Priestia koreensis]|uniref:gluconokinase n=1 Tax=Priestia koreensis TaxID=284581 RepID=UPI00203CDDE6|nr:gluconokinase [Priestia koreensis]MCM3006420.1 gluconokinase [Priestia koreensis]